MKSNQPLQPTGKITQKGPQNNTPAGEIKYRFALDDAGKTVDVLSLQNHESIFGRTFRCLACDESMVARLGTQMAHHFSHKSYSLCSGETYLHQLAKQVFQDEFEKCLAGQKPFLIELPQRWVCNHHAEHSKRCQTQPKLQSHDLIPDVCAFNVEQKADDFVPDITLVGHHGDDIWIEIVVSHKCSEAKVKAGNRIVEIKIQSEADIELFRQHKLSSQDSRVKFINFKEQLPVDMCAWPYRNCRLAKRVVMVYADGKWDVVYLAKDQPYSPKPGVVWWEESFVDRDEAPITLADFEQRLKAAAQSAMQAARAAGHTIRACGLCEHFDEDEGCTKFNTQGPWQRAVECEAFSLADHILREIGPE